MAPTIRIDDEVWAALKKRAEPFVDTPNDVLRRLLDLNGLHQVAPVVGSRLPSKRLPRGVRTPEEEYYGPILQALVQVNGRGRVKEILDIVRHLMGSKFRPADHSGYSSTGELRWRNAAQWARNTMANKMNPPLLNPSSPRGWWEITEAGRRYLAERAGP